MMLKDLYREEIEDKSILAPEYFEEKEILGNIFMINLKRESGVNTLELSIEVFKFDNDICETTKILCNLPLKNIKYVRNGEEKECLDGMLEHESISGLDGFKDKMVKLKYHLDTSKIYKETFADEEPYIRAVGLVVTEIEFLDIYKKTAKLIIENQTGYNSFNRTKNGKIEFNSITPSIKLSAFNENDISLGGSYYIGEMPRITANEISKIVGPKLEGRFDKETFKWLIKMDVDYSYVSETENQTNTYIKHGSYLFDLYNYKAPELKEDDLYAFHIGCGWKLEGNIDDNETPGILSIFKVFLYHKILESRA